MAFNFGIHECNKYFLQHRIATKCRGYTRIEFIENPPIHIGYVRRFIERNEPIKKSRLETLQCCYDIYFGTVTNFRPAEAIRIYTKYNATSILDPCAGWGGRCFAAMHCNIPYFGYDTNIDLAPAYDAFIKEYTNSSTAQITFEDSAKADFSKLTYNMVFTSPPYWSREQYKHMPNYKNKKDWITTFLEPMIRNSYKYLAPGGHYCINVPKKMYPLLVNILGEADIHEPYHKLARNTTTYSEYIYIWRKPHCNSGIALSM